jgi:putative heme degradation protein
VPCHTCFDGGWGEVWYYPELIDGETVHGFEFFDQNGSGFHKVILCRESDWHLAGLLCRAFHSAPLHDWEISQARKTNHFEVLECEDCQRRCQAAGEAVAAEVSRLLREAARKWHAVRVVIPHPCLLTVHSMTLQDVEMHGLWLVARGMTNTLFIRPHGVAEMEWISNETAGGSYPGVTLLDDQGEIIVTLLIERPASFRPSAIQ